MVKISLEGKHPHGRKPVKAFQSYEQQLALLENKYGLKVENEGFALEQLKFFGYYDLIAGYRKSFMSNSLFKESLSFQYIWDFIIFDKNIQAVLMQCSAMAENAFKAKFTYVLGERLGVFAQDYLNPLYYKKSKGDLTFTEVQKQLLFVLNSSHQPTAHYREDYHQVPPWILAKNTSFSNMINLFSLLKRDLRDEVAHALIPQNIPLCAKVEMILASLDLIRRYRNVIAHGLDFLSFRLPDKDRLPSLNYLCKIFLPEIIGPKSPSYQRGACNIYAYFLAIVLIFNNTYLIKNLAHTMLNLFLARDPKLVSDYCTVANLPYDFMEKLEFMAEGYIFKDSNS